MKMFNLKTLISRYSHPLPKPYLNPYNFIKNHPNFFSSHIPNSISHPIPSKSTKFHRNQRKNKRPLDLLFKEALGLCENVQTLEDFCIKNDEFGEKVQTLRNLSANQVENGEKIKTLGNLSGKNGEKIRNLGNLSGKKDKNVELKKKLWELELEIRELKAKSGEDGRSLEGKDGGVSGSKTKTLGSIFGGKVEEGENSIELRNVEVFNELSGDMEILLRHLYDKGYFKNVNFLQGNKFDISCFDELYARNYMKSALDRFGNDHQEISKQLSDNDVKVIAVFGCPTLNKRDVFAAKKLRIFFKIKEQTVCSKCVLKESCKFVNQSIWKGDNTSLKLASLLKLLRAYSLEEIPLELKLTDDLKACVSRLIREVVYLTKGASEAASIGSGELADTQKS